MHPGLGDPSELAPASPNARCIRIVLVEGQSILRAGLKVLIELETEFKVVGEFDTADACLAGIRSLSPDVVLTDLALAGRSGIELLADMRREYPRLRNLVLTAHANEEHIRAALKAGADGYVLKDSTSAELMFAIRSVATGRQFLCEAIAGKILSGYLLNDHRLTRPAIAQSITGREREVLTRIALGNSNKTIARELGVSPKTVEKHRSNLMRKLQLHNVAAITMFAIRNGMTSSEPTAARTASRALGYDSLASRALTA